MNSGRFGDLAAREKRVADNKYKSLVPQYTFSDTLEAQEAELSRNPLMLRLIASRQGYDDPHRPIYHYVNPEGRLNDPNGLCFWQGRWHLFYQAYPPEDPRQHWGHAVSDDLIHWRDLPLAIYPDPERCCFSGSTLVEEDRVIAMYHGTEVGNMVAVSSDPLLLNWEKVTGQPVIPMVNREEMATPYAVHDPCIWWKDGFYFSLSNGTSWRPELDYLFRSKDLVHWEYLHPFIENDRYTIVGDDGACPYFWPVGNKYALIFFSHKSGGQYFLGDYDKARDKFVVTSHGKFNFGAWGPAGVHAPSATPDGNGGIIVIFNMNKGKPTEGWDQIMTLPRRLWLTGSDELRMEPAGNVETLRGKHVRIENRAIHANREVVLEGIEGNAIELVATIEDNGASMVALDVLRSPGGEEYTRIVFYRNRGFLDSTLILSPLSRSQKENADSLLTIDSSCTSVLPAAKARPPETGSFYLEPDEPLALRIFIDKSVVEVFVNDKQCVAVRVYPGREDSIGVSIRSQGEDIMLRSLDLWKMEDIYS